MRWSYLISVKPKVEIKAYKERFEGLIRVEAEFESKEESDAYSKPGWMGDEITDLPIGRDTNLPDLSQKEFRQILASLKG